MWQQHLCKLLVGGTEGFIEAFNIMKQVEGRHLDDCDGDDEDGVENADGDSDTSSDEDEKDSTHDAARETPLFILFMRHEDSAAGFHFYIIRRHGSLVNAGHICTVDENSCSGCHTAWQEPPQRGIRYTHTGVQATGTGLASCHIRSVAAKCPLLGREQPETLLTDIVLRASRAHRQHRQHFS